MRIDEALDRRGQLLQNGYSGIMLKVCGFVFQDNFGWPQCLILLLSSDVLERLPYLGPA